jgi:amino acid transporter
MRFIDNAIYPVLFLDYLLQVVGKSKDSDDDGDDSEIIAPVARFCLLTSTIVLLAYVNWRGLALVGKMSVLICVAAMSPFVILVVIGSFKVDPSRWWTLPNVDNIDTAATTTATATSLGGGVLWRPFLNNLFWNLNSFDSAGCLVAELDSTASFVRAMMLGVSLVVACYFFPLLVAIGSSDSEQSDWTDGYLAAINTEVVGPWLGAWTVFAAGISNIGLFQAELSSDAFQLMGMADRGYLPNIFRQRSKHGTPTYGLILGTVVIVAMGVSDLDRLIEMLNFNYGFALLMEYAAFFKLRVSRPNLERRYRIPLNTMGCAIVFFPTVVATMLVMSLATYATYYFALASWITGYILFATRRWNEPPQGRFLESIADNNRNGDYGRVMESESSEDDEIENAIEVGAVRGDCS